MPALGRVDEALLAQIVGYEREAARYGLSLLHECGIHDADQWFFDYSASDCALSAELSTAPASADIS